MQKAPDMERGCAEKDVPEDAGGNTYGLSYIDIVSILNKEAT